MSQEIDLKKIEKKFYLAFHQDGIWDLSIGLALMGAAICMVTDYPEIAAIFPVLAIIMIPSLKKSFIHPRLGYVKFSEAREKKEKGNISALAKLFSLTAVLGMVVFYAYTGNDDWQLWLKSLGLIPLGTTLAIIATALGFLYEIKRCHLYSVLVFATFFIGHNMNLRPATDFFIIGLILSLIGLVLFLRFIGNYSKPTREEVNGI
ncbi:MAG: hypothetical protein ABIE07_11280 [Candidatus Zixiibacteriota bacterium]